MPPLSAYGRAVQEALPEQDRGRVEYGPPEALSVSGGPERVPASIDCVDFHRPRTQPSALRIPHCSRPEVRETSVPQRHPAAAPVVLPSCPVLPKGGPATKRS